MTLRVDGPLHRVRIGRTHVRTHVRTHIILLIQDLQIRVIDAATGELLRELILDPNTPLPIGFARNEPSGPRAD